MKLHRANRCVGEIFYIRSYLTIQCNRQNNIKRTANGPKVDGFVGTLVCISHINRNLANSEILLIEASLLSILQ